VQDTLKVLLMKSAFLPPYVLRRWNKLHQVETGGGFISFHLLSFSLILRHCNRHRQRRTQTNRTTTVAQP